MPDELELTTTMPDELELTTTMPDELEKARTVAIRLTGRFSERLQRAIICHKSGDIPGFKENLCVNWSVGEYKNKARKITVDFLKTLGIAPRPFNTAQIDDIARRLAKESTNGLLSDIAAGISIEPLTEDDKNMVVDYFTRNKKILKLVTDLILISDICLIFRDNICIEEYNIDNFPEKLFKMLLGIKNKILFYLDMDKEILTEESNIDKFKGYINVSTNNRGGRRMIYKKINQVAYRSVRRGYHPDITENDYEDEDESLTNPRLGLEIECCANKAEDFDLMEKDSSNFFYTQADGSLPVDLGREITLFPINYKDLIEEGGVIDCLIRYHTHGKACSFLLGNTGLHIHVSRKIIASKMSIPSFLERLILFYYGDAEILGINKKVFLRERCNYCSKVEIAQIAEIFGFNNIKKGGISGYFANKLESNHHEEISIHDSGKTIEFRAGKGVLSPTAIKNMCEYVALLTMYCCSRHSAGKNNIDSFRKFCSKRIKSESLKKIIGIN